MKSFFALFQYFPLFRIIIGKRKYGWSLFTLLYAANGKNRKITGENFSITYDELFQKSLSQAFLLQQTFSIKPKEKIILIGNNSQSWLIHLIAFSGLSIELLLINPKMKAAYIQQQLKQISDCKVFIDTESQEILQLENVIVLPLIQASNSLSERFLKELKNCKSKIVNLSSGTKGKIKNEKRSLAVMPFLSPYLQIITKLKIHQNDAVLISISGAHGYGLAALFLALITSRNIYLSNTIEHCKNTLMKDEIDCWVCIPDQLATLLPFIKEEKIKLKKIISGADILNKEIVEILLKKEIAIYNLYGTTETGIICIATPSQLKIHADTLGKALSGVKFQLRQEVSGKTSLWVNTPWSANERRANYIFTGDFIRINKTGFWFHEGRADEQFNRLGLLSSQQELEQLLAEHFPNLDFKIIISENRIKLQSLSIKNLEEKQYIENKINKIFPKHLRPDEIVW